jgi:hypothetical protein
MGSRRVRQGRWSVVVSVCAVTLIWSGPAIGQDGDAGTARVHRARVNEAFVVRGDGTIQLSRPGPWNGLVVHGGGRGPGRLWHRYGGELRFGGGVWWRQWVPYPLDGVLYPVPVAGAGGVDPRLVPGGVLPAGYEEGRPLAIEPEAAAVDDSALARAEAALARGQGASAAGLYRQHLAESGDEEWADGRALRLYGVALLMAGRVDEAVGPVRLAHQMSPSLGEFGVGPGAVGGSAALRRLVVRAVRRANEVDTGSAWLLAAVLVQGEGRLDVARDFIGRAERAGLEAEVVSWLRTGTSG